MRDEAALPTTTFDHHGPLQPSSEVNAQYADLLAHSPVAQAERHGGYVLVSGYECARAAANDVETFRSGDGVMVPPDPRLPRMPALEYDGPEHKQWRGLLDSLLNPQAVRDLTPLVTEIIDHEIDGFARNGRADLAVEFAEPVPAIVVGRMVGLTREESLLSRERANEAFASIGTPEFEEKNARFAEYSLAHIAERRQHPRNDFLTVLAGGMYKGVTIDDGTAVQILTALLMGGHHSTSSGISGTLRYVLTEDGVRAALDDEPRMLSRIIEESLRLTTPLQMFARTAAVSTALGQCPVPQGTRLLINYAAANRDPQQFSDPDKFDLSRQRIPHLAFGAGAHLCGGLHLARLEIKTALTRLLNRFPDLHVSGEITDAGLIAGVLMSITALPVAFTPE